MSASEWGVAAFEAQVVGTPGVPGVLRRIQHGIWKPTTHHTAPPLLPFLPPSSLLPETTEVCFSLRRRHPGTTVQGVATPVCDPVSVVCSAGAMMGARDDGEGAARRRRERRLRSWLKHERQSVAMSLSEYKHHSS